MRGIVERVDAALGLLGVALMVGIPTIVLLLGGLTWLRRDVWDWSEVTDVCVTVHLENEARCPAALGVRYPEGERWVWVVSGEKSPVRQPRFTNRKRSHFSWVAAKSGAAVGVCVMLDTDHGVVEWSREVVVDEGIEQRRHVGVFVDENAHVSVRRGVEHWSGYVSFVEPE